MTRKGFNPWKFFKDPETARKNVASANKKKAQSEKWKQNALRMGILNKKEFIFPKIPVICGCGKCNDVCWGGTMYKLHHHRIGKSSPLKGIKLSEEHKRKNSVALSGINNPMYGRPPSPKANRGHGSHYTSPLQGQIWLRSSYELAYAKYLDSIHELWYYEIETFDLGNTTYTPDFFLPRQEKFIEIKGYKSKEKTKMETFLEQYPWDLDILYKKDLLSLGIIVK